jgi:hypothetical protein
LGLRTQSSDVGVRPAVGIGLLMYLSAGWESQGNQDNAANSFSVNRLHGSFR